MSDTNRVLALKYRPRRFEDLVGQDTVSQTLSLALDSDRLSHAYLFSGLRGSGKTSTARIMAKALLCSQGPTSKPCEVCENCQSANSNRHLDIIEMDAASNRGIDDIKDLIEHTKYKPSSARFKVFIIDEVHMLTTQAFNALLKTLEEPPGFVKFILATTDPLKLPATILSRTQHFRFKKIASKDVIHHLTHILNEEGVEFETEALEIITRSGQGSLRDTLTLLDQAIIFAKGKVTTTAVVDMLGLIDPSFMDKIFETILQDGDINPLIESLEEYEASAVCDEMSIYLKDKMLKKDPKFDILLFDRFFRIIGDAKHLLALNSDASFVLILTLSKMIEATNLKTIEEIISEVETTEIKEVNKPMEHPLTQAVNTQTVVEHAQQSISDVPHITPLEPKQEEITPSETKIETAVLEEETKIEPVNAYDTAMMGTQTVVTGEANVPLDVVDAVEQAYPTPFDLPNETLSTPQMVEPVVQQTETMKPEVTPEPKVEEVQPEPEPILNPSSVKYDTLTAKVYERSHELGECFEKNFIFESFEDNVLHIISYAQDADRKFLYKHFGIIKTFAQDVFGATIDLEFTKGEVEKKSNEPLLNEVPATEVGSMVEEIEMGSGCVADMQKTANPKPSQQELQMEDILNSTMLNKAKELFDIKKITVKAKS